MILWDDRDINPENPDDEDDDDDDDDEDGVTCRRCRETGLQWQRYWKVRGEEGARLVDEAMRPHICNTAAGADEFPSG